MSAIAQALTDKDFLQAQPPDQKKYLASVDSDFAKASPADQDAYHAHVVLPAVMAHSKQINAQPTQFEKDRPAGIDPSSPGASSVSREGPVMRGLKAVGSDVANAGMGLANAVPGVKTVGAIARGDLPGAAMSLIPGADVSEKLQQMSQLVKHDTSRGKEGYSPLYRGVAAAGEATGVVDPTGMEESAKHGDTAGVVGHTVLPLAGAAVGADSALTGGKGLKAVGEAASSPIRSMREVAGRSLYDEAGKIRNPYEVAVKKLIPDPGEAARGAQQIRSAKAAMETDINKGQLQRAAAHSQMEEDISQGRQERAAGHAEMEKEQAKPTRVATSPGPYRGPASVPGQAPALRPVVPRGALSEPSEGRPATWDNPTVEKLARWGDPDAVAQKQLRMLGGEGRAPLNFSTIETSPKEVIHFGPEGKPLGGESVPETPQHVGVRPVAPRSPSEIYQRPAQVPTMAGKGAPPIEMNAAELAEIRKASGHQDMSAPLNDLGGMKRAGDESLVPIASGNQSLAAQRMARNRAARIREARP